MKNLIFIFILGVLVLSGCTIVSPEETETRTGGVDMTLSVYPLVEGDLVEDEQFNVLAVLENNILEPVNVKLCVTDGNLGGIPSNSCKENQVSSENSESIIFGPYAYQNLDPIGGYRPYFFATLNYNVDSNTLANICIVNPEPTGEITCQNKGLILGSGIESDKGPLQVDSLDYSFSKTIKEDATRLNLDVNLISVANQQQSTNSLTYLDKKNSFYMKIIVNNQELECDGGNNNIYIMENLLNNPRKTINCRGDIDMNGQDEYDNAIISINLKYNYEVQNSVGPFNLRIKGGQE